MLAHKAGASAAVGDIPAAAAEFLHRLSRAAGVQRHQADAARARARPISAPTSAAIRSRPSRRSAWAIPSSATACRWRAPPQSTPNMERRPIAIMGDGGFWHNGLITGVASNLFNKGDGVLIVMQNGYASATGQQYLPSSSAEPQRHADRHDHRADLALARRQMAAHGAQLQRRQDGQYAEGGDAHRRARPQGDHRRRRMPARAPAPRARRGRREARARRARGADALRRRRRDLHRRPFLHPPFRLPLAHGQAQPRSACAAIRWRP